MLIDGPSAEAALAALRAWSVSAGGNLIVLRCPTSWKAEIAVWGEPRGDWELMRAIKRRFDPAGLLNPGRFLPGM